MRFSLLSTGVFYIFFHGYVHAAIECGGEPHGIERAGFIRTFSQVGNRVSSDFSHVVGPFEFYPNEVRNLRQGGYTRWHGGYNSDGVYKWEVVDLDVQELIVISGQIWDKRASYTRPFDINQPLDVTKGTVIRRWASSDGQRYERQIVSRFKLSDMNVQKYVCLVNDLWRSTIPLSPAAPFDKSIFIRWWNDEERTLHEKLVDLKEANSLLQLIGQFNAESQSNK